MGSVPLLSAGYVFYIPKLHISFTNNLPNRLVLSQLSTMP